MLLQMSPEYLKDPSILEVGRSKLSPEDSPVHLAHSINAISTIACARNTKFAKN